MQHLNTGIKVFDVVEPYLLRERNQLRNYECPGALDINRVLSKYTISAQGADAIIWIKKHLKLCQQMLDDISYAKSLSHYDMEAAYDCYDSINYVKYERSRKALAVEKAIVRWNDRQLAYEARGDHESEAFCARKVAVLEIALATGETADQVAKKQSTVDYLDREFGPISWDLLDEELKKY